MKISHETRLRENFNSDFTKNAQSVMHHMKYYQTKIFISSIFYLLISLSVCNSNPPQQKSLHLNSKVSSQVIRHFLIYSTIPNLSTHKKNSLIIIFLPQHKDITFDLVDK